MAGQPMENALSERSESKDPFARLPAQDTAPDHHIRVTGRLTSGPQIADGYFRIRRRAVVIMPTRPVPIRRSAAGSGTVVVYERSSIDQ